MEYDTVFIYNAMIFFSLHLDSSLIIATKVSVADGSIFHDI